MAEAWSRLPVPCKAAVIAGFAFVVLLAVGVAAAFELGEHDDEDQAPAGVDRPFKVVGVIMPVWHAWLSCQSSMPGYHASLVCLAIMPV